MQSAQEMEHLYHTLSPQGSAIIVEKGTEIPYESETVDDNNETVFSSHNRTRAQDLSKPKPEKSQHR